MTRSVAAEGGHLGYALEKLSDARRMLMLPHDKSEADDLVFANERSHGLREVHPVDLDDSARPWPPDDPGDHGRHWD